jgi:ABC-type sugar transport system ATPase subunit
MEPAIKIAHLSKSFGNIEALRDVSLDIYSGEILAIVGDNGAGKSTLIKILAGALTADQGQIMLDDKVYSSLSPGEAISLGISTVYQDLALVDCLDVISNIFLGRELVYAGFLVDRRKMQKEAVRILQEMQIFIPSLNTPVGTLSGGQRQGLAVARAIFQGGKIIIFDEPTAAMGLQESAKVIKLLQRLRKEGMAVVAISHNLHQVFEISDRICVMRHGQVAAICNTADSLPNQIVELIMGASNNEAYLAAGSVV